MPRLTPEGVPSHHLLRPPTPEGNEPAEDTMPDQPTNTAVILEAIKSTRDLVTEHGEHVDKRFDEVLQRVDRQADESRRIESRVQAVELGQQAQVRDRERATKDWEKWRDEHEDAQEKRFEEIEKGDRARDARLDRIAGLGLAFTSSCVILGLVFTAIKLFAH